jgi:cytochrome c oxidase subunit 4
MSEHSEQQLPAGTSGSMTSRPTVSGRPYVIAWLGLLALTLLSFGAHYLPLGPFGTALALAIALLKALVVLVVFMHLRREPLSIRCVAALNLAWVALLCAGVALDVATGIDASAQPAASP